MGPLALACLAVWLTACGGIPERYVVERSMEDWRYRRYQRVLDVELAVEGNAAVGHTATYLSRDRSRPISAVHAFVTVYERAAGLGAALRGMVRSLHSYEVSVDSLGGGRVWRLEGQGGERWALWVSGRHIVKVGAASGLTGVPESLVSGYMGVYPSDLDEHGRSREGTESASPNGPEAETDEIDTPDFLREDAPR